MKNLMLCNTSYQILVAMWMKYRYLSEDVKLILSLQIILKAVKN